MSEIREWAKEVAHMIKDQRGYTVEQFEDILAKLERFVKDEELVGGIVEAKDE